MEFHNPVFLIKINSICLAGLLANTALLAIQLTAVIRINGAGRWYALGKVGIYSPARPKAFVKGIRYNRRAFFLTRATAGALAFIYVTRLPTNRDLKIPGLAFYLLDLCIGQKLDIGMSTDIQHFRRDYSDGTVIGGKCLV